MRLLGWGAALSLLPALALAEGAPQARVCLMQDDVCTATEAALADIGRDASEAEIERKLSPILIVHYARAKGGACVLPGEVEVAARSAVPGTLGPRDVTLTKLTTAEGALFCTFADLGPEE